LSEKGPPIQWPLTDGPRQVDNDVVAALFAGKKVNRRDWTTATRGNGVALVSLLYPIYFSLSLYLVLCG
jgi:hypothetical protein